ncbi:coth protein-domain-containing protein [Zychaea mexicana]|uniref:coth protein-domain-containing protein n=1 Tax=Zychaea mexicana TaxID=64656 RepID=UPI0022FE4ADA|nr:coth protein-domain-containing protein [Zychaea mexicana]KAI9498497.1 coth protein-domain-containing protein [Zychaea mexicana]
MIVQLYILALLLLTLSTAIVVKADDINYAVIAFPSGSQGVAVSVDGQTHQLQATQYPNLYQGKAPAPSSSSTYQYVLTSGSGNQVETTQRNLANGATSTGNEFFNRSRTVYDVPSLPVAYHPLYPPLFTGMNVSNEIATIILSLNQTGFDDYQQNPSGDFGYVQVYNMTYISSKQIYTFQGVGIKTSGGSTKDYTKQSYKIKMDKFNKDAPEKPLLFGRSVVKLRAHPTDMTFAREKLLMDCLAAAGAATLSGSWTRLYVNDKQFGLYLMIDDASTHFIDNVLHAGNYSYPYTGPTYKGNALSDTEEANLAYVGDDPELYSKYIYDPKDDGELKLNKSNEMEPIIGLTKRIASNESVDTIVDPKHTLIHMAFNFLTGSWDGFWYQASNYYINQNIQSNKWTVISYDFDETFGNGAETSMMTIPYTEFKKPGGNVTRPLQDALIQGYAADFEQILTTVVKRFFKPSVIQPILEAWEQMLLEDITWDRSIPGHSARNKTEGFTVQDFIVNMNSAQRDTIGVLEWVRGRSAAVCQQLNINDTDVGLPVLGHYTGGTYGDGAVIYSGHPNANGNSDGTTPSGDSSDNDTSGASGSHSSSMFLSTCIFATLFSAIITLS